ncbi:hypothetical protein NDU88_006410 [Pleurodeles waltl]|uniref:Uncharacterized protein n=1 Tax=Pleurodeles waltl TaxID=8319 RepID=A0AAV7VQM9_PLEWA|nr:hypothetical protein NDU88_006410 [Pleurodeles waltl]
MESVYSSPGNIGYIADEKETDGLDLHRAHERDERREELRRAAYGAGAGWLASRLAHRECKREREVASGVQRTRSGGTLRVNRRNRRKQEKTGENSRVQRARSGGALRVNRRKQPQEAGKLRSRVSTVRGAEAAGGGSSFREQASATRAAACFSPAPSQCGLRRGH